MAMVPEKEVQDLPRRKEEGRREIVNNKEISMTLEGFGELRTKLLSNGGNKLEMKKPIFSPKRLLSRGKMFDVGEENFTYNPTGKCGDCFGNVLEYFRPDEGQNIYYGYALSMDEWVQHYWLVKDGEIIEVTPSEEAFGKYFGMDVTESLRDDLSMKKKMELEDVLG